MTLGGKNGQSKGRNNQRAEGKDLEDRGMLVQRERGKEGGGKREDQTETEGGNGRYRQRNRKK